MPRTFIRQDTQIYNSVTYDDTLPAGVTLETGQTEIEGDLNALRSQVKRWLYADAAGNWYDDVPTVNSKKRGISALNVDLDDLEEKRLLFRRMLLADINVPVAQNWVVLSVAGGQAPAETAAVGAVTTNGAVVAYNSTFNAHSLAVVSGPITIQPKNLLVVRDTTTFNAIMSSGRVVWGLLQSESSVDGHTFNDGSQQVQISFVRENATGDNLEAVPLSDIQGKQINYSYVRRINLDAIPEEAFLVGAAMGGGGGGGVGHTKGVAVVLSAIPADTNATGAGLTPNLDAVLPNYSTVNFVTDVDVFLNGVLIRNGIDSSANHDVYPGDVPSNGDLKFEFKLRAPPKPDVLTMIVWG
jgi:hypothetical protein